MLNTIIQNRQTGKTNEVIGRMKENGELLLVIPHSNMRNLYPNEIQNRIITVNQLLSGDWRGRKFNKIIFDEGFTYQKDDIAKIYYYLGENHMDVESYGTI